MRNFLQHIKDRLAGKVPAGTSRSGHWPKVRADFLKLNPTCSLCGGSEKLEVHHVKPFHLEPSQELSPNNLITLCESGSNGINCHLAFGHLGNFKSFNGQVRQDTKSWAFRFTSRPKG